ncbi:MAG: hypothetical protein BRC29_02285 [Nanohaloarchaea archaeon SW_7_43_1]|nr:MAG: hypothetical protein BRC29_02285 [Nanohaloarchaea archaeon SW_7_43_1]
MYLELVDILLQFLQLGFNLSFSRQTLLSKLLKPIISMSVFIETPIQVFSQHPGFYLCFSGLRTGINDLSFRNHIVLEKK